MDNQPNEEKPATLDSRFLLAEYRTLANTPEFKEFVQASDEFKHLAIKGADVDRQFVDNHEAMLDCDHRAIDTNPQIINTRFILREGGLVMTDLIRKAARCANAMHALSNAIGKLINEE